MAGGKIDILVEPDARQFPTKLGSQLRASAGPLGAVAKGIGLAVAAGTVIAAVGLKAVIDKGIEYQDNLNILQAVSHATGAQMAQVGAVAKALGNDLTLPATSAADAAAAMSELAKGGLSVDQAMSAAKGTLQLAAAAQIDAAQAATIQSQALNAFGLSADSAGHVADVLANSANAASGEITDFAQAMAQVGAVAHQFGLSIDETSTALGLFANAGIRGSDAGTLIKSALLALANPSKPAAKAIEALGLKTYDATGKFVGLKSIFDQLHGASERMTDQQYQQATATVFGSDAVRLAGVAAGTTAEQWNSMATAIGRSGGAAEVAAAKTQGLGGAIEGFKSQVETVGLTIFEAIAPPLEAGVRQAAKIVNDLGPKVATGLDRAAKVGAEFGPKLAKSIESKAVAVGQTVLRLVKPIADGAKGLVDSGLAIVRTTVDGVTGVLERAAKAAQPVADGIGKLEKAASTASGPLGAVRVALELTYGAAQLVVTVITPLVALVGGAISVFAGLPGPIQTAAIALLALKVGPAILGALKNSLSGVGKDATDAATKTGLVGRAASAITAPIRIAAGAIGSTVTTLRQFGGEAAVQRALAASTGESIGRLGGAAAALRTSTIPGIAALRSFGEQASQVRAHAVATRAPISAISTAMGSVADRSAGVSESIARIGASAVALRTSTAPGIAALRSFGEQASNVRANAVAIERPMSAIGAGISTIVERSSGLSAMRASFQQASDGADRFGRTAGLAAAAGTGIKTAASGLVGVLGGPWGIALAGAGIALSLLSGKQENAAKAAADHKAAVDGLTNAYKASGGQLSAEIVATNNKALADKNVAKNAELAGSSFGLYTKAANGNQLALDKVSVSSDDMIKSILKGKGATDAQVKGLLDVNHGLLKNGGAYSDVADKVQAYTSRLQSSGKGGSVAISLLTDAEIAHLGAIYDGTGAVGAQIKANEEARKEYLLLAAAANSTSSATIELWEAQRNQSAAASNAAGANLSYREALKNLEEAQKAVTGALKEHGQTSTEYKEALFQEEHALLNVAEAKRKDAESSSKAKDETGRQHDGLVAFNAEIARLAKGYEGELPQALQTVISKMDVAQAVAAGFATDVNAAGQAIVRLPNGKEIAISVDASDATATLTKFKNDADAMQAQVTVGANIDPATGQVVAWQNTTRTVSGNTTTFTNTDPATGKVITWKAVTDAAGAVTTTTTTTNPATGQVETWVRDTNGKTAMVKVNADTSAAEAKINQVTRDRTGNITMIVRTDGSVRLPNGNVISERGNLVQAKAYAAGGVHKLNPMRGGLATIVPPNTWRVVGDRLTDDEFYIPDDNAPRSLSLLAELAKRRGFDLMRRYADGGVAGRSGNAVSVQASGPTGPFELTGRINLGGTWHELVDARIEQANQKTGSAIRRGRRVP